MTVLQPEIWVHQFFDEDRRPAGITYIVVDRQNKRFRWHFKDGSLHPAGTGSLSTFHAYIVSATARLLRDEYPRNTYRQLHGDELDTALARIQEQAVF